MVGWDIQNPHNMEATFTSMPERGRCETFAIFWFLFFNINHQYLTLWYILISQWISSRWACSNLLLMSSLHQIGLAIGLNPSWDDPQSVMFPLYRSDLPVKSLTLYEGTLILMIFFCSHTAPRVELGGDDTVGLQKIYGPKKKPTSTEIWVWEKTTESCVFGNILTWSYFPLELKVLYFTKNTEDGKILSWFEFKTNWKFCSTSRETYGQNDRAISKERRF